MDAIRPKFGLEYQTKPFMDVQPADWAYPAIETMRKEGIFVGYPDGTFHPDEPISRREMAAMMAKFLRLLKAGTISLSPGYESGEAVRNLEARLVMAEQKINRLDRTA